MSNVPAFTWMACLNKARRLAVTLCALCLIKLHKQPVSFCFLACSTGTGFQQPAVWAARMLAHVGADGSDEATMRA